MIITGTVIDFLDRMAPAAKAPTVGGMTVKNPKIGAVGFAHNPTMDPMRTEMVPYIGPRRKPTSGPEIIPRDNAPPPTAGNTGMMLRIV